MTELSGETIFLFHSLQIKVIFDCSKELKTKTTLSCFSYCVWQTLVSENNEDNYFQQFPKIFHPLIPSNDKPLVSALAWRHCLQNIFILKLSSLLNSYQISSEKCFCIHLCVALLVVLRLVWINECKIWSHSQYLHKTIVYWWRFGEEGWHLFDMIYGGQRIFIIFKKIFKTKKSAK